jgi:two-component system NtrC family response regulator
MLRFLQERVVERVGGRQEIPVDVRVICATNQDLQVAIGEQRFREDLFYRVSEITINIPPLREREGCRLVLARTLLENEIRKQARSFKGFSQDAQTAIQNYPWPGNVREMENKIKGAVIMAEGKQVTASDLGLSDVDTEGPDLNLREVRRSAETRAITRALVHSSGNISRAAKMLGITRPTLYDLLDKYDIKAQR